MESRVGYRWDGHSPVPPSDCFIFRRSVRKQSGHASHEAARPFRTQESCVDIVQYLPYAGARILIRISAHILEGGRIVCPLIRTGNDRKTIAGKQHRDTGRIAIRNLNSGNFAIIAAGAKPDLDNAIARREHRIIGAILPNDQRTGIRQRHQARQLRHSPISHFPIVTHENGGFIAAPHVQHHWSRFRNGNSRTNRDFGTSFPIHRHRDLIRQTAKACACHRPTGIVFRQRRHAVSM